jgi:hypothetical protein
MKLMATMTPQYGGIEAYAALPQFNPLFLIVNQALMPSGP